MSDDTGWTERAVALVRTYAQFHPEFMAEDVRTYAEEIGFAHYGKSWGQAMRAAAKAGIIEKARHAPAAKVRWRSLLYQKPR